MKCSNHLEKDALGVCNSCGKSICSDCLVEQNNESYCVQCINSKKAFSARQEHSPGLAFFLSFMVPGLGQCYNGQFGKGILILLTSWLFIPWVIGMFDAYAKAKKIRESGIALKSRTGCMIAFVAGTLVMSFLILLLVVTAIILGAVMVSKEERKPDVSQALPIPQIDSPAEVK